MAIEFKLRQAAWTAWKKAFWGLIPRHRGIDNDNWQVKVHDGQTIHWVFEPPTIVSNSLETFIDDEMFQQVVSASWICVEL